MRVGVDIGGTKTEAVAVDGTVSVRHRVRVPTGAGAQGVVDAAALAVAQLGEQAGVRPAGFESIGVGVPGRVDSTTGRVAHAVNLGVAGLDLADELAARLGVPVRVENDVNAAALGASHLLGARAAHSLAYLNLGTGLAGGLVLGGSLWRGARGTAGEIGHIPVDPAGPVCPCGQRGCLELTASGSAVTRMWPGDHPQPVRALFEAAGGGDPRAVAVRARFLENVAAAVRVLVLTADVEVVVIGGGISSLGGPLLSGVCEVLERWAAASPFLDSLALTDRVVLLPQGFPAAAVGAALVGVGRVQALVA